jgi:hypothetical protein
MCALHCNFYKEVKLIACSKRSLKLPKGWARDEVVAFTAAYNDAHKRCVSLLSLLEHIVLANRK